jgi:NitT/TauT family transport system ATP-binding protein
MISLATVDTAAIALRDIGKVFVRDGTANDVLRHVDLTVADGAFLALVGRSGSGKSTLLNVIAGLTPATNGTVAFFGEPARYPRTDVGYLTQKDTLLPWLDVAANVGLPLALRNVDAAAREKRTADLLRSVGLAGAEHRYPRELSGGMLRRASLARMLAGDPRILLLDEPFGALDAQLRADLQAELLRLWTGSGKTVVFVTHDIDEALVLGDRVVALRAGGEIALDVPIDAPRPRDARRVRTDPVFTGLHERLLDALHATETELA